MTQRELTAPAPVVLPDNALVVREPAPHRPPDMTTALMATPSDQLPAKMEEIRTRRVLVRKWLLSLMEYGLHYGRPAGQKKDTPEWKDKPSLYQSGADLVIEAECLRPEFVADEAAMKAVNRPDVLIYACRLHSQITGQLLGEGRGAAVIGKNDFDANKGVKMACKRAKCAAVLNTYGLSDIFTQDLEGDHDNKAPAVETPKNPNAPKPPKPRTDRVTPDELTGLLAEFKADRERKRMPSDKAALETFVHGVCGMEGNPLAPGSWMRGDFEKVREALTGVPY